jgi:hypothetical protein
VCNIRLRSYWRRSSLKRTVATYRFKVAGLVAVFLYEIPYLTVLAVILVLRPVEGFLVIRTKIFVYFKPVVSEFKFKHYAGVFGLACCL